MSTTVLANLERDMGSVSLGACSDEELKGLVRRALSGRQVIDGFVNQLTAEARRREATGSGTLAEEVIRSGVKISNREAKTLDRRAGVGEVLPEVGDALDRGAARSENADTLARELEKLTDTQRTALAGIDGEIAPAATRCSWFGCANAPIAILRLIALLHLMAEIRRWFRTSRATSPW